MFENLFKTLSSISFHTEMIEKFEWDEERYYFALNILQEEIEKLDPKKGLIYKEIEALLLERLIKREISNSESTILISALKNIL